MLVARPFAPYDADVLREVVAAQAVLGEGERRPGTQAVFGEPICVPDLAARIGLDADTNTNFTRRMLLLLESRELHGDVRRSAIEQILGRYLYESHTAGPAAALPAQRRRALLAHDLRRLRGQGRRRA